MLPPIVLATPDVVVDSTIFSVSSTGPISGNPVQIDGNIHGAASGSNLFFSFSAFNLPASSDSAVFSCSSVGCTFSAGIPITNVIARINSTGTGGASVINGQISFGSNLSGANLWMFNPQGFLIGSGASINIPGAFRMANATSLSFGSESFGLEQDPQANQSMISRLSSVNPVSFGFTTIDPDGTGPTYSPVSPSGGINLNGGQIVSGGALEIRGSQISFGGSTLTAGGTLTLSGDNLVVQEGTTTALNSSGNLLISGQMSNRSTDVSVGAGSSSIAKSGGVTTLTSNANITNYGYFEGNITSSSGSLTNTDGDGLTAEISGNARAATSLTNEGIIRGSATSGTDLTNSGTLNGNIDAGQDLINTGTINIGGTSSSVRVGRDFRNESGSSMTLGGSGGSSLVVGRNMTVQSSTVTMSSNGDAEVRVGGELLVDSVSGSNTSGKLRFTNGGKASLIVANNITVGSVGNGSIERTGSSNEVFLIDPINPGTGIYVNNSGSFISDSRSSAGQMQVLAAQFISLNGGGIYRTGSSSGSLLLVSNQLTMANASIYSSGSMLLGQLGKILTLSFIGSGSSMTAQGNIGSPFQAFFILPTSLPYGNIVGSTGGVMYVEAANLQAIRNNPANRIITGTIASPSFENGFNVFLNPVAAIPSGLTDQIGAVILDDTGAAMPLVPVGQLSNALNRLGLPADHCGAGSSLQLNRSNGVVTDNADVASFSVFPDAHTHQHAFADFDPFSLKFADNRAAALGCSQG